jgi:replication factor C subunit 3/5
MTKVVPEKLQNFLINKRLATQLLNITKDNLLNTLFIGKRNSGKKTLINSLLNNLFEVNVNQFNKIETKDIKIGNNKVSLKYISSPFHYEINLYEYGLYDKNMVNEFIKELTKYTSIKGNYKFIILKNIDKVSKVCQVCLRTVMDKTFNTARFIFTAENINKIEYSFLSRLNIIRVPLPKIKEIEEYVSLYIKDTKYIKKIINYTENNLFIINNIIKIHISNTSTIKIDKLFKLFNYCNKINKLVIKKNISSIIEIRAYVYQLILLNIPINCIMKNILKYIFKNCVINDDIKIHLTSIITSISYKNTNIDYDIIGLEFFILKVKKILIDNELL